VRKTTRISTGLKRRSVGQRKSHSSPGSRGEKGAPSKRKLFAETAYGIKRGDLRETKEKRRAPKCGGELG